EEEDPQDSRQTDLADSMTSAGITFMVADPVDDILYMANDDGYFFQYNLNTLQLDEVLLSYGEIEEDEVTEEGEETTASNYYIPTAMVYAESSDGDKILITTTTGEVIVITPGGTGYTVYTLTSSATTFETTSPNLSDISLTPDGNYAYVVDSDNDLVWVFHVVSEQFIDQQSSGTSLDPIELEDVDDNNAFTHILIYSDAGGDVAYLAGANGLTLIDAETPGTATATKIIDPDTTTTGENPIALSGTPGPLITTSADTGYLFSINGDASISVLTDNPWITLSSISTDTVTTETASTFSLTFQSDTAGSYTIKANSDLTADSGTELIASTAFAEVDTDITTADIDVNSFARTSFVEGENKIFVFVTDVNSLLGHSAIILNVDRPPEPVTITGVSFGNRKAYVQFEASPDADIDHYVLYAEPAANQATPACPGALTFVSDNAITTNVSTSVCTDDTCEGTANNLTNDTAYCVAVSVVDESDQASALSAYTQSVTPEQTVGPAGYFGETSCSLNSLLHKTNTSPVSFVVLLGGLGLLLMTRFCSKEKCHPSVPQTGSVLRLKCWDPDLVKSWIPAFAGMTKLILILSLMSFSHSALAQERSPQHWTLEPKLSFWIPTDTAVRDFMGLCCHIGGEVEFGYLIKNQFNITATTGFSYDGGQSVGLRSGGASGDSYNLFFFPFRFDFLYRFDYKP
ncbi:MAG TPA: hypothetical protein VJC18_07625, partial [bacterium]|nr:hypothetical protein [bacterium]